MTGEVLVVAILLVVFLFLLSVFLEYRNKPESVPLILLLSAVITMDIAIEEIVLGEPWKLILDIIILIAAFVAQYLLVKKIAGLLKGKSGN